ncbi:MAG: hypothetical protein ACM3JD_16265, partial [Rudaea sp.]
RVSGERLRHELYLIFAEAMPENALARLQELGMLDKIQGNLHADEWLADRFRMLRESLQPTPLLYLGLMSYRLRTSEARQLAKRLRLSTHDAQVLQQVVALRLLERQLGSSQLTPARVVELVERFDDAALVVFAIATDSARARAAVDQFRAKWRAVQPLLSGADLRLLGIPPGPVYRDILAQLREKRLEGELTSRAEEEEWVKARLAQGGNFQ